MSACLSMSRNTPNDLSPCGLELFRTTHPPTSGDLSMTRNARSLILAALCAGLSSVALGADLMIEDPYARAVPPGQPNSAVFMVLENGSDQDRSIVAAESDVAETVELHTHTTVDGMMQMRRIDAIALPAGETVTLQPGGLHVMLIGLKGPLTEGSAVDLTLVLDDGTRMAVSAPVRSIGMSTMQHQH
jgi:copper(I)-binding protein